MAGGTTPAGRGGAIPAQPAGAAGAATGCSGISGTARAKGEPVPLKSGPAFHLYLLQTRPKAPNHRGKTARGDVPEKDGGHGETNPAGGTAAAAGPGLPVPHAEKDSNAPAALPAAAVEPAGAAGRGRGVHVWAPKGEPVDHKGSEAGVRGASGPRRTGAEAVHAARDRAVFEEVRRSLDAASMTGKTEGEAPVSGQAVRPGGAGPAQNIEPSGANPNREGAGEGPAKHRFAFAAGVEVRGSRSEPSTLAALAARARPGDAANAGSLGESNPRTDPPGPERSPERSDRVRIIPASGTGLPLPPDGFASLTEEPEAVLTNVPSDRFGEAISAQLGRRPWRPGETAILRVTVVPQELGPVQVVARMDGQGHVTVQIHTATPEAQALIQQQVGQLWNQLQQNQIPLQRLDVSHTPVSANLWGQSSSFYAGGEAGGGRGAFQERGPGRISPVAQRTADAVEGSGGTAGADRWAGAALEDRRFDATV